MSNHAPLKVFVAGLFAVQTAEKRSNAGKTFLITDVADRKMRWHAKLNNHIAAELSLPALWISALGREIGMRRRIFTLPIIASCLWGTVCSKESAFIPELSQGDQVRGADAALRNFTAEAFRKGVLLWRVAAREGYIVQIKDETLLYDLRIEYFESNRKSRDFGKSTIITAAKCILQQGNKFMTISGNVLVEAPHGRKMKTQELFWDEAKDSLYSNVPVTVLDGSGNVLTGTRGIVTDRSLSRTVFKGGVGAGSTRF
jgi:LPS export ABC transporter protein LptC